MNSSGLQEHVGYLIRDLHGLQESFEREYYDLIRSAFLKYSFQARIGNMDGVLVTYHNTARIFGFQYVPLEEMDERLYGNKRAGQTIFERCMMLLEIINTEIVEHFPEQVRLLSPLCDPARFLTTCAICVTFRPVRCNVVGLTT